MKFDNHIALRFLTDKSFWDEIIDTQCKNGVQEQKDLLHEIVNNYKNRNYFVTNTVLENLELFDTKKAMTSDGWRIFSNLPDWYKKTFIFPDNVLVRIVKIHNTFHCFHLHFSFDPGSKSYGRANWCLFWIDLNDGRISSNIGDRDTSEITPFIYALLCFMELTDNDEVELKPGQKTGTKKQGKIINSFPQNLIIVNSRWNTITKRSEGFPVRGHIALRYTGAGRTIPKLVYIEPYQKTGYTRKSGKELNQ